MGHIQNKFPITLIGTYHDPGYNYSRSVRLHGSIYEREWEYTTRLQWPVQHHVVVRPGIYLVDPEFMTHQKASTHYVGKRPKALSRMTWESLGVQIPDFSDYQICDPTLSGFLNQALRIRALGVAEFIQENPEFKIYPHLTVVARCMWHKRIIQLVHDFRKSIPIQGNKSTGLSIY